MKIRKTQILILLLTLVCLTTIQSFAQQSKSVWTIDFVKVKNNQLDSAVISLQKNWGAARFHAKKMKLVKSYLLLIVNQEIKANADYDILLITEYPNKEMYNEREKNFDVVFKKHLPNWVYINGNKTPRDYTEIKYDLVFEGDLPFSLKK